MTPIRTAIAAQIARVSPYLPGGVPGPDDWPGIMRIVARQTGANVEDVEREIPK